MITPMTMHDSICKFLEREVAEGFLLKSPIGNGNVEYRKPQVIRSGWVLPKSVDDERISNDVFPFICPWIQKVENVKADRASLVTLQILFGVYDPGVYDDAGVYVADGSGYRDLWNLIEATRQAFFSHMTIDKRFSLVPDFFEAEPVTENVLPYWEGYCRTKWHVMFPLIHPKPSFNEKGDL